METIDIVVETPRGSTEKYTYEPAMHAYKLHKILPTGMAFPFDFGFIPGTKGEDGDPLDVLMLSEYKSFPGCVIECRIAGAILATQSSDKGMITNDRYIGIPVLSKIYRAINSIKELPAYMIPEIEQFFMVYNEAQGKTFKITKAVDAKAAYAKILKNKQAQ